MVSPVPQHHSHAVFAACTENTADLLTIFGRRPSRVLGASTHSRGCGRCSAVFGRIAPQYAGVECFFPCPPDLTHTVHSPTGSESLADKTLDVSYAIDPRNEGALSREEKNPVIKAALH